jgi:hypothetical protein
MSTLAALRSVWQLWTSSQLKELRPRRLVATSAKGAERAASAAVDDGDEVVLIRVKQVW